jgi:hypothetical protein
MSSLKSILLAGSLLIGLGGVAGAQMASTYDPAQLPEIKGKVAQYTLTPRGDVDGLILNDGTEVHFPPNASTELVFAVHPGDVVTIHGLKAKAVAMVAAASITNDGTGTTVTAQFGRGMHRDSEQSMQASGTVKLVLHGPRGDANGALLNDGTEVRMPPHEADKLGDALAAGKPLFVKGNGISSPLGKVILARQVGPDESHLTEVAAPWAHGGPWMHEGWMHGHGGMMGGHRPGDGPDQPKP